MKDFRSGQSFVELLIAIAVGAIFIVGIAMTVGPSLTENGQSAKIQVAATNAESLMGNLRTWSEGSWQNVLSLATGSSYQYYLITSSSPYVATSGIQSIVTATTTYTDYFYISDVYRDTNGNITSTGTVYDPSTKQFSVVYSWTGGQPNTMTAYLTRNDDATVNQTNWAGGINTSSVATSTTSQFTSSSNVDYTQAGSLYVSIPGY